MSATWATVLGLCATTALIKGAGPVLLGGRELPAVLLRMIALLAPALLAALVVVETVTDSRGDIAPDARLAGLAAAAGVLWWRRDAMLGAVAAAALTAAALRALT